MPDCNRIQLPVLFLCCLLVWGCANVVSPSGGPVDKDPPKVVSETPANGSINFSGKKIHICFDEYVQLKEAQKNIVFSPPLEFKPTVSVTGHCVTIELDRQEKLKKDITYTIAMAGAIMDIHEGNTIPDYTYAFATGVIIDSNTVSGSLAQAFTQKKEQGYSVGLFSNLDDSTLFKEAPTYTGQTYQNGQFRLKRVKAGKYFLAAYKDENTNLRLDPGEWLAYLSEPISVSDSIQFQSLSSWPGPIYSPNRIVDTLFPYKNTTLLVFYRAEKLPALKKPLITRTIHNGDLDSVYVFNPNKEDSITQINYSIADHSYSFTVKDKSRLQMPHLLSVAFEYPDSVIITSTSPIKSIQKDSIRIMRDTIPAKFSSFVMYNEFRIGARLTVPESNKYTVKLGKGFTTDIYGQQNIQADQGFFIKSTEAFGSIGLNIKNTDKRPFIIQLIDERDNLVRNYLVNQSQEIKIKWLEAGTYRIRMIHDANNNGKWDVGDIKRQLQPEKVYFFSTPIQIRADWDIDNNFIDLELFK